MGTSVNDVAPVDAGIPYWPYLLYTKLRCLIETQSAEGAVSGKSNYENLPFKRRKLEQGSAEGL